MPTVPASAATTPTSQADRVSIYYQYVRGLRTKINDLFLAVADCNYDVIILTETGLNDCIDSLQIFGSSFSVFRCDRNRINSNKTSFGGVLIAVNHRYSCVQVRTCFGERLEQIFADITIGCRHLLVGAVYIPPDRSHNVELFDEHVASVRELCDIASFDDHVLICGDYNQPRLQWIQNADDNVLIADTLSVPASSAALLDGMDFMNMTQINYHRNQLDRTLDLVFCSDNYKPNVNPAVVALLPVGTHHPPLEISIPSRREFPTDYSHGTDDKPGLDFGKVDYELLCSDLQNIDWDCLNVSQNVNEMASKFCFIVQQWLQANVPAQRPPKSPAWSTSLLRKLKRERNTSQRKHRAQRSLESKLRFQCASNAYCSLNSDLYKAHVMRVQTNLKRNPKSFWKFVNSKRKNSSIPKNVVYDNAEAKTSAECCELFARFFESVFNQSSATDAEAASASLDVPLDLIA
ncbi:uncharacterized protein LOC134209555 [Armigeres subalbatus]|uniref:uncharacterized protein LOC134209555 n=1 Tax=Armigeres subalbatus TaxID=124917 RepID=UPI002ED48EAF